MSFLKNKLVIIVIIAILWGGLTGLYLSGINKSKVPDNTNVTTGTGTPSPEKVAEVINKLNNLTK